MGSTGSLEATEAASAAVQKTPNRVSLDSMNAKVAAEYFFTADKAIGGMAMPATAALDVLTVCIIVMRNGFTVIGKSAPADPANFNEELGRKVARADAVPHLFPLEGYALREKLSGFAQ